VAYEFRGLSFDQFEVGRSWESQARTITEADIVAFAGLSGDFNPLHTDETFAAGTPHGTRIAHGMLTAAMATGMANQLGIFEGTTLALLEQTIAYKGAVKPGDTVRLTLTVAETKLSSKGDKGVVSVGTQVANQDGHVVLDGVWKLLMKK
jgi:acyl dehydratase